MYAYKQAITNKDSRNFLVERIYCLQVEPISFLLFTKRMKRNVLLVPESNMESIVLHFVACLLIKILILASFNEMQEVCVVS